MTTSGQPYAASWRRVGAAGAMLLLALTGCGSTALRGGTSPAGVAALDAPGAAADAVPAGEAHEGGGSGGTGAAGRSTGGPAGSPGTTNPLAAVPGATEGTAGGGSAPTGTGASALISKKPLRVGVYGADVTAIYAAFGKADEAPDDAYSTFRAMAKYLNAHGGIGGRQISLLTHTADSAGDASTEGQKACAAFTQDNKVDIVYDSLGSPVLAACLRRAGVASTGGNNYMTDATDTNAYPNWLMPSAMRIDRLIRSLLEVSAARGTLKHGDKLGVMVDACPYGKRVYEGVIVPFARKLGIDVVQSSVTCVDNLVEDLGPVTNDVQRAALSFSASNVTHVIALHGAEAFLIANFTTNASQQRYFPKYLVTSNAYAWQNSQSDAVVKISKDAVPNVSGVGFLPLLDVGPHAQFGAAQKQAQSVCTKADPTQYGAAGKSDSGKWFALSLFYSHCTAFLLMKDEVEAGGMRLDFASVRAGFNAMKDKHTVSAALTNGRLGGSVSSTDGAGFVQAFVYDEQKTFVYVGSPLAVKA